MNDPIIGRAIQGATATRRGVIRAAGGLAGILATGRAPAFAQAQPQKMIVAHVNPVPETGAVAMDWFAKAITERSKGELPTEFQGGTLLNKEIDIINGVKSGNIAMGTPAGAARRDWHRGTRVGAAAVAARASRRRQQRRCYCSSRGFSRRVPP